MNTKPGEVVAAMLYREDADGQVIQTVDIRSYGFNRQNGDDAARQMAQDFIDSTNKPWTVAKKG